MSTDSPEPTQSVVTVDGVDLPYIREGRGTPLLVIGSATYYPKAYSAYLRNHFDLFFVDGRHFVPSHNPPQEELDKVSLETFVDDVEAARRTMGIEQVALLGHSVHAQIAIRYATKYPQNTSHLVLLCGVPYAFAEFAQQAADFWEEHASEDRKEILARNQTKLDAALAAVPETRSWAVTYRLNSPLYWSDPSFDTEELLEGLENGVAMDRLGATLPSRTEVREALEQLEMPILVVLGGHDYAIPYPAWEELIAGLDNITYRLLDEASHNPQTEHPELLNKELISWFAGRRG